MSGHSKWAKIKQKKGAADAKRSNLFSKLSRNVTLAARKGGDPEMNFSLRLAIDKARAGNMPKDVIEKAIKKGTGESGGAVLEEVIYEGYGPGGIPVLIEGITDNKQRTTPEIKALLAKSGGSLGTPNSVAWMFDKKGVLRMTHDQVPNAQKDELSLELIDAGAEDVIEEEGGLTVYTSFNGFEKVRKFLTEKKIEPEYAELEWVAKDQVETDEATQQKTDRLIELLEEHDDVNSVYTNLK